MKFPCFWERVLRRQTFSENRTAVEQKEFCVRIIDEFDINIFQYNSEFLNSNSISSKTNVSMCSQDQFNAIWSAKNHSAIFLRVQFSSSLFVLFIIDLEINHFNFEIKTVSLLNSSQDPWFPSL